MQLCILSRRSRERRAAGSAINTINPLRDKETHDRPHEERGCHLPFNLQKRCLICVTPLQALLISLNVIFKSMTNTLSVFQETTDMKN